MVAVTAKMVADLRVATGAGMMECKKSLVEADGDFDKATEILRIKSGAKATKLAGRSAVEGIVVSYLAGCVGAMVEINCETDFVAKDESFKEFADEIAKAIVDNKLRDITLLSDTKLSTGLTVEERRKEIMVQLGENINVRRFTYYETENQITSYIHGNKLGVLVEFKGDEFTAREVAMHIAALRPQAISSDQVDSEVIKKERHIYTEQVAGLDKPAQIINKMIEGKVNKFLAEITLLSQQFVKNPEQTVAQLLQQNNSMIIDFTAYQVGEGMAKKVTDYVAEVAAATKV